MATAERTQYNEFATKYASLSEVPSSKIEAALIDQALGRPTGLTILDLGGGNGAPARRAVDAGAALVDVVDISSEMLRAGEEIEGKLGRQGRIRWFEADATRPLAEQITASGSDGLRAEGYDIVMANWLFDHATSVADLEGMWANVVSYLKPGGRFLGIRMLNPYTASTNANSAKYGVTFSNVEAIPGGWKYTVECWTQPPFSFEATSMESSYTLLDDIPRRLGLVDFATIDPRETPVVKSDQQFWEDFVKEPSYSVVLARKPSEQG
ncbi:S-adenosyl-L-methionine-dependent methyltransferase, Methyltransferase domain 25 [Madurella fahalii]|uniref:S-adenosyl-L-methionine-dependent methyltransferase, Methyltransferase domain 25 n=1 Tax=Madurella fahalii TaxID=1157608 RepID=A0ABQ0FXL0_9PEZI